MAQIQERGSTHVYKVKKISKEEMEQMVARCVYEHPPFCSAACPLKLDVRAFLDAAAAGNSKKALQLYEKIAPFPLVLAMGCEAPCEKACRLTELGEGVAIRAVEEAVSRYGQMQKLGGVFRTRKRKTVAVFGSGLFALFLAGEIEKKAYPLTVFCAEPDLESFLHSETDFLDEAAFAAELKRLKGKDIQFEFSCTLTKDFLEEKRAAFDVACCSADVLARLYPEASSDPALMFCESERLVCGPTAGVLDASFGAKKAALTVDRLAQNLDPNNMRGSEAQASRCRQHKDKSSQTETSILPPQRIIVFCLHNVLFSFVLSVFGE